MSPKSVSSFLILSFLLCGISALPGGWSPISDLNDPLVQDTAKFAVAEYGKKTRLKLVYESVIEGQEQIVEGMNFRLIIKAKHVVGGHENKYEAVVWVKPWLKFKKLISFKRLSAQS